MSEECGEPAGRSEPQSVVLELTDEENEVLKYLRASKRVDLRWLSEEEKLKITRVLDGLHNGKRISLFRISKEVGRSYTAIWGLCRALQIHTRNVAEADRESAASRSKHKRTPFAGSPEDAAYMLGFKNGDLTAWQVSGTAVMVTSSTTHPGFAKLFRELFQEYGHVYEYPMYEKDHGYKWKLAVRLDNSFKFLTKTIESSLESTSSTRSVFLSWLAGIIDSDGHVRVGGNNGQARVTISIYSTNHSFLISLKQAIEVFGYRFDGPYLTAREGETTPKGITYRDDFWNIALQRTAEAQGLLREMPLRHGEKVQRKKLALSISLASKWVEVEPRVKELRKDIKDGVEAFVRQAEVDFLSRKKRRTVLGSETFQCKEKR